MFLDKLVADFVVWAQDVPECRSIVLFGSTASGGGDVYSDRDIQVMTTHPQSQLYIDWMREYAPLWVLAPDRSVQNPLWALMYRGGHKVHLSVVPVDDLQEMVDRAQLSFDFLRGYQVLLDKDGLAAQLPPTQPPTHSPPTEETFRECIHNFFYGTVLIAKHLKRDNLWTVQWANGIEGRFMLQMIEWHARAFNPDVDTHYRGEHMKQWVSQETWQALHEIAGRFDAADGWRALFAMTAVFRQLAQEAADRLNYPYPADTIGEIVAYLEGMRPHSAVK